MGLSLSSERFASSPIPILIAERPSRRRPSKVGLTIRGEPAGRHEPRAACLYSVGQRDPNPTQRKVPSGREDEERLSADIVELARQYGRYGYRKIAELLPRAGWLVNDKRVERIWRREGLKVPTKQPKRGRLWLTDGSCIRLRPEHRNHVWSYDFVEDRTHNRRRFRMLNVIDEFTHECLAIRVQRQLKA